jgi:putative transposase
MGKSRFTDEQIAAIVRESHRAGAMVSQVASEHGISERTLYRWRKRARGRRRGAKALPK